MRVQAGLIMNTLKVLPAARRSRVSFAAELEKPASAGRLGAFRLARGQLDSELVRATAGATSQSRVRVLSRIRSIDILRGLVMVLMALDHVRDYFMGMSVDPLDLAHTNGLLYATRWVTHFCAPVFILLTGVSAYLSSKRCTKRELTRMLVTRGLWLIALEWTVVTLAWTFNFKYQLGLVMQVIWVIGVSMIVLAALIRLPVWAAGLIGFIICYTHNLLDGVSPAQFGSFAPLWQVLHVQGMTPFGFVAYPLIPWVGVMAVGYSLGTLYDADAPSRRRVLIALGVISIATFILLRATNFYGDPQPWAVQADFARSLMSFLNVAKYPPSLLYLLATLGPALVLLATLESARGRIAGILETFGSVPLFFYILHIVLAHLAAGLVAMTLGYGTGVLGNFFLFLPPQWGVSLGAAYAAWLWVLVTVYPACLWYAGLKRRRRDWWLIYL
jgi:uncharacterized membrane protein